MQIDNPDRGFSYKGAGPLDMRMDPVARVNRRRSCSRGMSEAALASLLTENADEPHAGLIAALLKQKPLKTTHDANARAMGLTKALPTLSKTDVKMSVRRTFQALRIAVNDEFSALDALLRAAALSRAGRPGGDHDLSFGRRSTREESVPGGFSRRHLRRRRARGDSILDDETRRTAARRRRNCAGPGGMLNESATGPR